MLNTTKEYLEQMNANTDDKATMLRYIVGNTVLDVGVGGGVLGKLIRERKPHLKVIGLDINFPKLTDPLFNYYDDIVVSDARHMTNKIEVGEVDTIIFSSVLHEVYSYNGFDKNQILNALLSAYYILPKGGRIIIRDGVKTENNDNVEIRFFDNRDVYKVIKFAKDFKGRQIEYQQTTHDRVVMPMNDAMEFLYTYTWGDEHYEREVQEQYGVFTPREYINFVRRNLGMELITYNHYLQEGYNYYLSKKVELYDSEGRKTRFPDSNILMVFQKQVLGYENYLERQVDMENNVAQEIH